MNLIVSTDKYYNDEISKELVDYLSSEKQDLENAIVYYEYPIYMDIEDQAISSKILLISPSAGVLVLNCSPVSTGDDVSILDEETSQIENYLFSKFIKSKILPKDSSKPTLYYSPKKKRVVKMSVEINGTNSVSEFEYCDNSCTLPGTLKKATIKTNTLQGDESHVVVEVLNAKQRRVLPKKMFSVE